MKLLSSAVLSVLCVTGSANAQSNASPRFEGLIVYRIQAGPQVIQQKSWIKGDSVVIEGEAPMPERSFANFNSRELTVHQGKNTQVISLKDFDTERKKTSLLQVHPGTKTINGKVAQLYTIEIPTSDRKMMRTSFWLTADYPESVRNAITRNMLIGSGDQMFRDVAAEIREMGKAPVMISASINEKESTSMEIVAVTEQAIPTEKFVQ